MTKCLLNLIPLIIFFSSSSLFALDVEATEESKSNFPENILNSKILALGGQQRESSEAISRLQRELKKEKASLRTATKALKLSKKDPHFQIFTPYLQTLYELLGMKSHDSLLKRCRPIFLESFTDALLTELNSKNQSYCRKRILDSLNEKLLKKQKLSKADRDFLKEQFFWLDQDVYESEMDKIFKNAKTVFFNYQKISNLVADFYFIHQLRPRPEILRSLFIGPKLQALVKKHGESGESVLELKQKAYDREIISFYKIAEKENFDEKKILKSFNRLSQIFWEDNESAKALRDQRNLRRHLTIIRSLVRRDLYASARKELSRLCRVDQASDFNHECLFVKLWSYIRDDDQKGALKEAYKLAKLYEKQNIGNKLVFWTGHTFLQNGKTKKALPFFETIIEQSPLSYYAILASKKLQLIDKTKYSTLAMYQKNLLEKKHKFKLDENFLTPQVISSLIRLKAWAYHGLENFVELELKGLEGAMLIAVTQAGRGPAFDKMRADLKILAASILAESKHYLSSFKILYAGLGSNEFPVSGDVLHILFPTPFLNNIRSIEKNIDPLILLALIRQESAFNPAARSSVGARGLMQLMPATARMVRKRRVSKQQLNNPKLNIKLGSTYFKYLLKRHDDNVVMSLAAYNAGERRVKRWQKRYFNKDSMLHTVEEIPFDETQTYVKLIYRNLFFYKMIQEETIGIDLSDPDKLFQQVVYSKH